MTAVAAAAAATSPNDGVSASDCPRVVCLSENNDNTLVSVVAGASAAWQLLLLLLSCAVLLMTVFRAKKQRNSSSGSSTSDSNATTTTTTTTHSPATASLLLLARQRNHGSSSSPSSQSNSSSGRNDKRRRVVVAFPVLFLGFWMGYVCGSYSSSAARQHQQQGKSSSWSLGFCGLEQDSRLFVSQQPQNRRRNNRHRTQPQQQQQQQEQQQNPSEEEVIPTELQSYVVGMRRIDRDSFDREIHLGVPRDVNDVETETTTTPSSRSFKSQHVLMVYSSYEALPPPGDSDTSSSSSLMTPSLLNVSHALQNCDYVNVILTHPNKNWKKKQRANARRQCLALVPQTEAFHIHRFGRIEEHHTHRGQMLLNRELPLRLISRLVRADDGHETWKLINNKESTSAVDSSWTIFQRYTTHLDAMRGDLSEILFRIVGPPPQQKAPNQQDQEKEEQHGQQQEQEQKRQPVIIMTCNAEQVELFLNFVCSARSRNLASTLTNHLLVFALDESTYEIVSSLGLTAYYNGAVFDHIPARAAAGYGSRDFAVIAMAKIWAAYLVSDLGYDFLLQDVDVIWYRNPLHYFLALPPTVDRRDIYYVDHGTRLPQHGPFFANTGFFYAFNNMRTRNFFNKLVTSQESVLRHKCDQSVTNVLLSEHASLYGLKVGILARHGEGLKFLNGFHFHRMSHNGLFPPYNTRNNKINNDTPTTTDPYIFHVSWSANKHAKIQFLQQLGEWRVRDSCLLLDDASSSSTTTMTRSISSCCSAQPLNVTCHMPNRPSLLPSCTNPIQLKKKK